MNRTIAELEVQRDQIDATLAQLRTIVAAWEGTPTPGGRARIDPQPVAASAENRNGRKPSHALVFERKYERTAKELLGELLRETRGDLHGGEMTKLLAAKGYEFKKQTIAFALKQLQDEGVVRRKRAPKGSGFSWTYAWIAGELPFGHGGANA